MIVVSVIVGGVNHCTLVRRWIITYLSICRRYGTTVIFHSKECPLFRPVFNPCLNNLCYFSIKELLRFIASHIIYNRIY